MAFLRRKQIILAKIESTYGTDPTPEEGADAILTKNLSRQMYEGNTVSRDLDLPYMGNDASYNTGPFATVSFDVELAGSGEAGTPPQYGPLLRACALSETIEVDTSVTYAPVSADIESITIYYNYDGEMQKIVGARGTVTLNLSRNNIPMLSFTFTGRYARPTAVPIYSPTYTAQVPKPASPTNTTSFSVHAQEVKGESLSLDLANNVVHRPMLGQNTPNDIHITDRSPTGNVLFEAVAISTKDYFAQVESHQGAKFGEIEVVHDVITINMPKAQLSTIAEPDSDGIRMFSMDYIPTPDGAEGNDEVTLAFTG